jgi:chromosomal replication initiation ATPase DnaA
MALEDDLLAEAKARRERLFHPPGGNSSTDMDILSEPAARALALARLEAEAENDQWKAEQLERERKTAEMRRYAHYIETVGYSFSRLRRIETIQVAVCRHYGISRDELLSQRRDHGVVRPRMVAMYLARCLTFRSWPEIARKFSGRDHTTVMHAFNRIAAQMATDPKLADEIAHIRRQLEGI